MTLIDTKWFQLGLYLSSGESDCRRAERLFLSSNTFGAVAVELRTLTSKSDPRALEDSKWRHGQKTVSASFCFFPSVSEFWQRDSMPGIFKAFRWGEGRISTSSTYFAQKKLLPGHVSLFSWSFSVTVKLNLNFYSLRLCVSNYLDL